MGWGCGAGGGVDSEVGVGGRIGIGQKEIRG